MKLLEGKVAIITGATRGIGKGVAEVFAKNGADIAFTYVSSDEKAKAIEEDLKSFGVKIRLVWIRIGFQERVQKHLCGLQINRWQVFSTIL